ncbi:hypothetical protein V8F20_007334 [Naviculisporaceae sp. PSN 640]
MPGYLFPHYTLCLFGLGSAFGGFAIEPWDCWTGLGELAFFSRSGLFLCVFSFSLLPPRV